LFFLILLNYYNSHLSTFVPNPFGRAYGQDDNYCVRKVINCGDRLAEIASLEVKGERKKAKGLIKS
jgi:hypothetical protein